MEDVTGCEVDEVLLKQGLDTIAAFKNELAADTSAPTPQKVMDDPDVLSWKRAIAAGMSNRVKEGQRFDRANDGGKAEKYKNLKSNEERAKFKLDWAAAQLEAWKLVINYVFYLLCHYLFVTNYLMNNVTHYCYLFTCTIIVIVYLYHYCYLHHYYVLLLCVYLFTLI